ncbi:protein kinase domain-containing protein [Naasia lichenicola]|uniref:GAF domain-containing protein n=1 Tax=Naasia lichenicola TaxID=2565933 RepID=A0A4S4FHS6_9MICO|nr:protein kinase [Naasia lichenicola]THG29354.1 GAF domain-containing protein [Naasia lichenicola]
MTNLPPRSGPGDPPQLLAGRYVIGEVIGSGGRAVVYGASDPALQREVAVKVFRAKASTTAELRLQEAEARLIAGMNHYALTTLFDAGVDNSDPSNPRIYLVMERIPGVDLKRHVEAHAPLSSEQVAYLGFDLAEGLQYVHEHGFLHRDIKPANVLLADRRITTRIRGKLADFGIASVIGIQEMGATTTGTAAYISPEQARGEPPTTASDIYSLGLVLLESLSGQVAFPGDIHQTVAARLRDDPWIPPETSSVLRSILRRMTARRPDERPGLDEVALEFQRSLVQDIVDSGRVDREQITENEHRRLAAVRRYNILDTPPDEAFDRITHLAGRLLDVPVALLSIVDTDREWFKSSRGADISEVDRNVAICSISVTQGIPFVVPDVQADPAFRLNPLLQQDRSLHGFASVPLVTADGYVIGTLCVFDREVRLFGPTELDDLGQLAAVAVRELDLRLASRRAAFDR